MEEQSKLWDKKYLKSRRYENPEDFFRFSSINPTIKALLPHIKDGMRVLEVGSGTGELISYLKYKYPNIQTYGVDFSSFSIERSKKVVESFGLEVIFNQSDISKMSFENNYFDIVFGDQVIGHIEKLDSALNEINRVTKKGGIVAFTTANSLRPDGWYFNKTFSKSHEGYLQKGMFPWTLWWRLKKAGFKKLNFYGEMLILFRNIDLIKSFFVKKYETRIDKKELISVQNLNKKSFLKRLYNYVEKLTPQWAKVTIGVVGKKFHTE